MPQREQPGEGTRSNSFPSGGQYLPWCNLAQSAQAFQLWQQLTKAYTYYLLTNSFALDISGKALESALQLRQLGDRAAEAVVTSMQVPTRSDFDLMMRKLTTLENLVRDLNDKVDQLLEDDR